MATALDTEMFGGSDSDDAGLAPSSAAPAQKPVDSDHEMEDDLFGDDPAPRKEIASRETSPTPSALGDEDGLTAAERRARQALEYEEEEDADVQPAILREAEVPVPNIPLPHSSDGNHWVVRMPNFVKIDSQPFHPDTYRGPEAELDVEEQAESLRERSMSIKLEVDNTMRWRWMTGPDGNKYRQSNSRIIRWSDGSMSLQLGKELFDVTANVDTSGSVPRAGANVPTTPAKAPSQSQSQSQTSPSAAQNSQSQDNLENPATGGPLPHKGLSYLVAQHQTSAILQVEAPVTGFLAIRPTGMQSETHRKLVRAVGQKHSKVARLRLASEAVAAQNPMMLNANAAKAAKKSSRAGGASSSGGAGARRRPASDDDDSDGIDREIQERRRAARSSYSSRNRTSTKHDYSDDDDDDDEVGGADEDDDRHASSPRKRRPGQSAPKAKLPAAGTGGEYQADDFLVEDTPSEADDEDEEGAARPRKRSSRVEEEADDEPDLLDKLDRDIEEQARKKRKETTTSGGGSSRAAVIDDDDDVDVESEGMDMSDAERAAAPAAAPSNPLAGDDDDDDGIPQTSRKPGKKRIIIDDDEDE